MIITRPIFKPRPVLAKRPEETGVSARSLVIAAGFMFGIVPIPGRQILSIKAGAPNHDRGVKTKDHRFGNRCCRTDLFSSAEILRGCLSRHLFPDGAVRKRRVDRLRPNDACSSINCDKCVRGHFFQHYFWKYSNPSGWRSISARSALPLSRGSITVDRAESGWTSGNEPVVVSVRGSLLRLFRYWAAPSFTRQFENKRILSVGAHCGLPVGSKHVEAPVLGHISPWAVPE